MTKNNMAKYSAKAIYVSEEFLQEILTLNDGLFFMKVLKPNKKLREAYKRLLKQRNLVKKHKTKRLRES